MAKRPLYQKHKDLYVGFEDGELPESKLPKDERLKKNVEEGWWQNIEPEELKKLLDSPHGPFEEFDHE